MIRIKICCISLKDEANTAISFGADAIGLVGKMPSGQGLITDDLICSIAKSVPPPVVTFQDFREKLPNFNIETEEHIEIITTSPSVKFDKKLKDEILSQIHEEGMVIVHCTYDAEMEGGIRIWKSTFLIDKASGDRSIMHHAENITYAPEWTFVPEGKTYRFTLIFAPLPKSCEFFDLLEDIPQAGGFFIPNIKRNKSDVYHVKI